MNTNDYFAALEFFLQKNKDLPADTSERIDALTAFCKEVTEIQIQEYIYSIGETSTVRLEKLKKQIWECCKYIALHSRAISEFIASADDRKRKDFLTSTSSVSEYYEKEEVFEEAYLEAIREFESDPEYRAHIEQVNAEWDEYVAKHFDEFCHERPKTPSDSVETKLNNINDFAKQVIEIIDHYLRMEKRSPHPEDGIIILADEIAKVIDGQVFEEEINGDTLYYILRGEIPEKKLTIKKGKTSLWIHLLRSVNSSGPECCQTEEWLEKMLTTWKIKEQFRKRSSDYDRLGEKTKDIVSRVVEIMESSNIRK